MDQTKPSNLEQYKDWAARELGERFSTESQRQFEQNQREARDHILSTDAFSLIESRLKELDSEYFRKHSSRVIAREPFVEIKLKSYESTIEKLYRKNVKEHDDWPNEPDGGFLQLQAAMEKLPDVLRSSIVVRYLDAVPEVCLRIQSACVDHNINCEIEYKSNLEGYYACHCNLRFTKVPLTQMNWALEPRDVKFEVQVRTMLQETMWNLLHGEYESRRMAVEAPKIPIAWNFGEDGKVFDSVYLSHTIHFVESQILKVRK